jgi:hypothetical protein
LHTNLKIFDFHSNKTKKFILFYSIQLKKLLMQIKTTFVCK